MPRGLDDRTECAMQICQVRKHLRNWEMQGSALTKEEEMHQEHLQFARKWRKLHENMMKNYTQLMQKLWRTSDESATQPAQPAESTEDELGRMP